MLAMLELKTIRHATGGWPIPHVEPRSRKQDREEERLQATLAAALVEAKAAADEQERLSLSEQEKVRIMAERLAEMRRIENEQATIQAVAELLIADVMAEINQRRENERRRMELEEEAIALLLLSL